MNYISAFKTSVQQNAEKPALVDFDGTRQTTYKELDRLSSKVAGKLHAAGCSKGSFIPVLMERRMEYMAAYLGVLKAGCVVVPLVPEIPWTRISYITNHCKAKLTIDISFFDDIEIYEPFEDLAGDDEPALLIYTSGSTGTPKGILHTVSSLSHASLRYPPFSQSEDGSLNFAAAAPLSFIAHVNEYLSQFLHGGAVHILSNTVLRSVDLLQTYFASCSIVNCLLPGQIVRSLTHPPDSLKKIVVTGEQILNVPALKTYAVLYIYGQAETCGGVTCFVINKEHSRPPVGKTADETEILILDENGNRVSPGIDGEICALGNFGVSYFKEPELSAKTFVRTEDGRCLIHTGDIGFIDENGDLNYVGRKDWMVKINGQRVETLEVERVLQSVEHIREAVVKAFSDTNSQNYLVGYYVSDAELSSDDIRISLAEKLPSYMIPRYLVRLDAIPKNQNGKTDRNVLTSPDISLYKTVYAAPSTPEEQALCAAFEEVLDCEKVGIHDDFFALGGDSIKVMKLLAAEPVKGLTLENVVNGKTPEAIAYLCSTENTEKFAIQNKYPLTQNQLWIFTACMYHADTIIYNMPACFKLKADVDLQKLVSAVKTVLNAHPYLKMKIHAGKGTFYAVRNDTEEPVVSSITCEKLPPVKSLVRPFTLMDSSLYRIELYDTKDGKYLFCDFHHIIGDAASLALTLSDIVCAYNEKPLTEETYTGFEVALIEEKERKSEKYTKAKSYYDTLLGNCDEILSLPIEDCSDGPEFITKAHLSSTDKTEIQAVCAKYGVTENVFFNTAFAYLLSTYTYQDTALYLSVYHGRNHAGFTKTFSFLATFLPICYHFGENKNIGVILSEMQKHLTENMAHDIFSYPDAIRSYDFSPDVGFAYQGGNRELFDAVAVADASDINQIFETADDDTRGLQSEARPQVVTRNNLAVQVFLRSDGRYELFGEANGKMYSEAFLSGFLACYDKIISEFLVKETLTDVIVLTDTAKTSLDSINRTEYPIDRTKTVVDYFRKTAETYPDNEALVHKDTRYTYKELDDITDRLASYLISKGIGKETVVGILLPRSEYQPLCVLGVVKAGAAYVPLDQAYPVNALKYMLHDSGAALLITTPELYQTVRDGFTGECLMADDIVSLPKCSISLPVPAPNDLFVIVYTSGSTGVPKGVLIEHRNVLSISLWVQKYVSAASKWGAYASFGFIVHLTDYFPVLLEGGVLHIIPEEIRRDLPLVQKYFNENGITISQMTTRMGCEFAQLEGTATLKDMFLGGEKPLPIHPPAYRLYSAYGFTEHTGIVTNFLWDRYYTNIPLGKSISNTKLYVVGKNGNLVPPGAVGELWVSGFAITRGYRSRPELTEKVFCTNPFTDEEGYERVYKSGDIVSLDMDGTLYFVGRRDSQVKIRGYRVELGEVEEVIRRFEGIKDAVVTASTNHDRKKFLAAFVISDRPVDVKALKSFIAKEKPSYMVPAVVMQIDVLPRNQNGKIDRKSLPVPKLTDADAIAPRNDMQKELFDIAAKIAGYEGFGIATPFYDAGIDSLGLIKFIAELERNYHITVQTDTLNQYNTIEKLAEYIASAKQEDTFPIQEDYPLSKLQKIIYSWCKYYPRYYPSLIVVQLKLWDTVDRDRFVKAVESVINAHPYLKTTFRTNDEGEVRAVRNDSLKPLVSCIKCDSLPKREDLLRPHELLNSPLYRAEIYETLSGTYFYLDMHHVITDGVSLFYIVKDICSAYLGKELEKEICTGFEAGLIDEIKMKSESLQPAKKYYANLLRDCIPTIIPCSTDAFNPKMIRRELPSTLSLSEINAYCAEHRCSANALYHAAFAYLLNSYASTNDVLFHTVHNGRTDSRYANSLSLYAVTVPIRCSFTGDKKIESLISDMERHLHESISHYIHPDADVEEKDGTTIKIGFMNESNNMEIVNKLTDSQMLLPDIMQMFDVRDMVMDVLVPPKYEQAGSDYNGCVQIHWYIATSLSGDLVFAVLGDGGRYSESFLDEMLLHYDKIIREFTTKEYLSEMVI